MTDDRQLTTETSESKTEEVSAIKEPKKKKKLKSFLWNFFFYVIFVGGIVFGLPRFLVWSLGTEYPMAAITSGSMWPVLKEGDLVFIQGVKDISEVKVGDIIVFSNEANNSLTIHRIIAIKEGVITTKGDANRTDDNPISFDKVVGRTLTLMGEKPFRIPHLGSVTVFASKLRTK
ncbi:MAG: signal peptidase, endoplasmic reticulum-type [Parcubacteria group bacterium Gr01-1014_20]|nr:MAG: signal peptidase, endoplasmic reticulum-type [Parcubacteria group bacterium Gr01-1014_20]